MTVGLLVVLLLVVAGPLAAMALTRTRFRPRPFARIAARIGIPALTLRVFVSWIFPPPDNLVVADGVALLCAGFATVYFVGHSAWVRWQLAWFSRQVAKLLAPGSHAVTVRKIKSFLLGAMPRSQPVPSPFVANVLFAVTPMLHAGFFADAEGLLRCLPEAWLSERERIQWAVALGVCRLRQGDLPAAEKALAVLARPARERADEEGIQMLEAKLHALAGRPDAALDLVGEDDGDAAPVADRLTVLTVRAHAFAHRGDDERAREALGKVRDEIGAAALDRVVVPEGPASKLAAAMRSGIDAPYR